MQDTIIQGFCKRAAELGLSEIEIKSLLKRANFPPKAPTGDGDADDKPKHSFGGKPSFGGKSDKGSKSHSGSPQKGGDLEEIKVLLHALLQKVDALAGGAPSGPPGADPGLGAAPAGLGAGLPSVPMGHAPMSGSGSAPGSSGDDIMKLLSAGGPAAGQPS